MQNRFFDEKLRRQKIAEKFRFLKQKTKQRRKIKCHAFQNSHQDRSIVMSSSTRRYDVVIVVVELSASRNLATKIEPCFFFGGGTKWRKMLKMFDDGSEPILVSAWPWIAAKPSPCGRRRRRRRRDPIFPHFEKNHFEIFNGGPQSPLTLILLRNRINFIWDKFSAKAESSRTQEPRFSRPKTCHCARKASKNLLSRLTIL